MAGKIKHVFRMRALKEFGRKYNTFVAKEASDFLNTYKNKDTGKIHRYTQSNINQVGNLLAQSKDFAIYKKQSNKSTVWEYIGSEEE